MEEVDGWVFESKSVGAVGDGEEDLDGESWDRFGEPEDLFGGDDDAGEDELEDLFQGVRIDDEEDCEPKSKVPRVVKSSVEGPEVAAGLPSDIPIVPREIGERRGAMRFAVRHMRRGG